MEYKGSLGESVTDMYQRGYKDGYVEGRNNTLEVMTKPPQPIVYKIPEGTDLKGLFDNMGGSTLAYMGEGSKIKPLPAGYRTPYLHIKDFEHDIETQEQDLKSLEEYMKTMGAHDLHCSGDMDIELFYQVGLLRDHKKAVIKQSKVIIKSIKRLEAENENNKS